MNAIWLDLIVIFLSVLRVALPMLLLYGIGVVVEHRRKFGQNSEDAAAGL